MKVITYKTRRGVEAHEILTPEEADDRGLRYLRDYKKIESKGVLILTDDDFVLEVLALGTSPRTKMRWIRTCIGTFAIDTTTAYVDTEPRESRYTFSGKIRKESHQRFAIEWEAFAEYLVKGYRPIDAYMMVYPATTNKRYAHEKALLLMSKTEVKKIVDRKLEDVYAELDIDDKFLIQRYKDLAEAADSDSVSLQAVNALAEIRGIKGGKVTSTTQKVFLGIPKNELAEIDHNISAQVVEDAPKELSSVKEDDDEVTLEDSMGTE